MPRKKTLPKFPYDYIGERAQEYGTLDWMEKNQKKTTRQCVEYLFDSKLGSIEIEDFSNYLILDLGCGTGFSSEALLDLNFNVVGIDILFDMIEKANAKKTDFSSIQIFELILASITQLPFQPNSFDFIVSISAYNFITYKKKTMGEVNHILNETAAYLSKLLKDNGRIVIEFYPNTIKELNLFTSSFTNNNFNGFYIKQNPTQKSGQTFLLLKKGGINYGEM
ncbi:MAG: methyltransferase domain-containing protein [Candidatus Lokiarchaeota archaeon]|nr:methyltransferase domain-containing protein [Candidatus Lokiarchaeota archaeon]MBD3200366.1 methyltransferase domain-containing protein [Candidatus Lokiarchaeota archaeon]